MSTEHWRELLQASDGLRRIGMARGILAPAELPAYHADLSRALRGFARTRKDGGLKVYIDRQHEPGGLQRIREDPPAEGESLEAWAERFFSGGNFGLIQNYLEAYTNSISERVARIAAPLVELHGLPPGGFSVLYFMGNYGFTPFGVHRGSPGEEGLLFHLGPAKKTFYTWETEVYNRMTDSAPSYHDIDRLMPYATAHELDPGDVIFFPNDIYHIAYTGEYSASLVLDFNRPTALRMQQILDQHIPREDPATDFLAPLDPREFAAEPEALFSRSLVARFDDARKIHFLQLKSNGGFLQASVRRPVGRIDERRRFRIKPAFAIQYDENSGRIFSRGHFWIPEPGLNYGGGIERLNRGETFTVVELLAAMGADMQSPAGIAFFAQIDQTDVLEAIDPD